MDGMVSNTVMSGFRLMNCRRTGPQFTDNHTSPGNDEALAEVERLQNSGAVIAQFALTDNPDHAANVAHVLHRCKIFDDYLILPILHHHPHGILVCNDKPQPFI